MNNLLKELEGLSSKRKDKNIILSKKDIESNIKVYPYKCSAGKWTIGWGCCIDYENYKEGISVKECEELFNKTLEKYIKTIKDLKLDLNDNQEDALISFCYNVGIDAFLNSTLLKVIKKDKNNFIEIEKQFMRWIYTDKKKNNGLCYRRKKEYKFYCKKEDINCIEKNIFDNFILYIKDFLKDIKDYFID